MMSSTSEFLESDDEWRPERGVACGQNPFASARGADRHYGLYGGL